MKANIATAKIVMMHFSQKKNVAAQFPGKKFVQIHKHTKCPDCKAKQNVPLDPKTGKECTGIQKHEKVHQFRTKRNREQNPGPRPKVHQNITTREK